MNTALRSGSVRSRNETGNPAKGSTRTEITFVHVHWEWITLLIVLVACSLAFLVAVMVKSKILKVAVLKSSSIATLLALGPVARSEIGPLATVHDANMQAKRIFLRLEGEDGFWKIDKDPIYSADAVVEAKSTASSDAARSANFMGPSDAVEKVNSATSSESGQRYALMHARRRGLPRRVTS